MKALHQWIKDHPKLAASIAAALAAALQSYFPGTGQMIFDALRALIGF